MDRAAILGRLKTNLAGVEERILGACRRSGRPRSAVTLIAVTKYVPPDVAGLLPELGVLNLGESRPQELWRKAEAIRNVRWHLIGHLQRNKVAQTLPLVHLIHSVDSIRLLGEIQESAVKFGRRASVLLEVNLSRETAKHGFDPADPALHDPGLLAPFDRVDVCGLMTMAALSDDAAASRPVFAALRRLREAMNIPGVAELSMGMTNDFEVAIEEGATLIRLGSALFEGIVP